MSIFSDYNNFGDTLTFSIFPFTILQHFDTKNSFLKNPDWANTPPLSSNHWWIHLNELCEWIIENSYFPIKFKCTEIEMVGTVPLLHSIRSNALMKINYICKIFAIPLKCSVKAKARGHVNRKHNRQMTRTIFFEIETMFNCCFVFLIYIPSVRSGADVEVESKEGLRCIIRISFQAKRLKTKWIKLKRIVAFTSDEMLLSFYNYFAHFDGSIL